MTKNLVIFLKIILFLLIINSSYAQQTNPNQLPFCPPLDNSKKTDSARVAKWNKCFGYFRVQFDKYEKGSVYEGEFLNGQLNGYGTHKSSSGNVYIGFFKNGQYHGMGTLSSADGETFSGGYQNGQRLGFGVLTHADGTKSEGFWNGFDLVSTEAAIKLTNTTEDKIANDTNQIFAIKPIYDWVGIFKEGLAPVRIGDNKSGKYGFINKQGRMVIQPTFDNVENFEEGLAAVRISDSFSGKWGFIDKNGIFLVKPQFDKAHSFSEGLAAVRIGDPETGKIGFIDKSGNFVINPVYDHVFVGFNEGLAPVRIGPWQGGKWGFIDKQGKFIIKPQYSQTYSFKDGLASVRTGDFFSGKSGVIDKQGNIVIPPQYDDWYLKFEEGLAYVHLGNNNSKQGGYIDKNNKFVIQPQFSSAGPFADGLAFVQIGGDEAGKWGVIDKTGRFIINPQFDSPSAFFEGIAPVRFGKNNNEKTGFIDREGQYLVYPQFDNYFDLKEDKFISPFFYEGLSANCIKIEKKPKCGFISKESILSFQPTKTTSSQKSKISGFDNKISFTLTARATQPDLNGVVEISIKTNVDTSSLQINGEEQGGSADGNYIIKKVARVGQDTQFKVTATDINGNSDTKTITVTRQAGPSSTTQVAALKPETINRSKPRDAVAIIIGIQNYKRVPNAEFANNDAREFSEYAIRALGIKPEKIKILLDDEADEVNIVKAFENWLPIQVNKDKTDVYVFYSGHGLPSSDGKSLYFLPHGVDKELLSRTAVAQNDIIAALTAAKPKSVTMFIDACYSGQTRGGDVLVANAKPVALKADKNAYPANFTVITASANDQISSSSPELKHGIFSSYLMKGMEGEADANQDGKITASEMQDYLSDKVSRQAMTLNRKQNTQLLGDSSRVLVAR